jgi:hypothetical protein
VSQIESVMGYDEGISHMVVADIISKVLDEADTICEMKAEYRIFDNILFNESDKTIAFNDQVFDIHKVIFGQIRKSDLAALFLCTAGEELSTRCRKSMKEGDLLKGYVYDVVGSETVEAAAELMQKQLENDVKDSGMKTTNRFSPGYCGWMVDEQHKLFNLMPDNYCSIRLTASALMEPIKSVSGLIGVGLNVKRAPYTCSYCDMENCIYRKKK